jgi:hypothetical protein
MFHCGKHLTRYTQNMVEMHVGLKVKCSLFLSDFKIAMNGQIISTLLNIKFYEDPDSGSWDVTRNWQTWRL